MKRENAEKYIFTIAFLCIIFAMCILSAKNTIPVILWKYSENDEAFESYEDRIQYIISSADEEISDKVYGKYDWIEAYGYVNRMLGKKEINGFSYALDPYGAYESLNFWVDAKDIDVRLFAERLVLFRDDVEARGGHFTFLLYPNKINEAWNKGYDGIPYNSFNEQADTLLAWLNFYGVDYVDFRETMKNSGYSFEEMFYLTDHHWTGQAAFCAYQELIDYMNDNYAAGLDQDGFYRDDSNYDIEWVPQSFLGSAGRNAGMLYADVSLEDFQTYTPKYNTNYLWSENGEPITYNSLVNKNQVQYVEEYKSDAYKFYLDGVAQRDKIVNLDNPDGPTLFFIRDSYASPMITYMAPLFSEIDCSWGKYTSDRYVKNDVVPANYDYVFVGYYPEDLTEEFFKFYADDVEQYKLDYAISEGYIEEGE